MFGVVGARALLELLAAIVTGLLPNSFAAAPKKVTVAALLVSLFWKVTVS
jgi:hypothetical protein